jgi:hypothetical protein
MIEKFSEQRKIIHKMPSSKSSSQFINQQHQKNPTLFKCIACRLYLPKSKLISPLCTENEVKEWQFYFPFINEKDIGSRACYKCKSRVYNSKIIVDDLKMITKQKKMNERRVNVKINQSMYDRIVKLGSIGYKEPMSFEDTVKVLCHIYKPDSSLLEEDEDEQLSDAILSDINLGPELTASTLESSSNTESSDLPVASTPTTLRRSSISYNTSPYEGVAFCDLKDICKQREVADHGSKVVLIERLEAQDRADNGTSVQISEKYIHKNLTELRQLCTNCGLISKGNRFDLMLRLQLHDETGIIRQIVPLKKRAKKRKSIAIPQNVKMEEFDTEEKYTEPQYNEYNDDQPNTNESVLVSTPVENQVSSSSEEEASMVFSPFSLIKRLFS